MRPRVWFGERWITSIFDQFEENVRYFPALLPVCDDEDPVGGARPRRHPAPRRAADAQRHHLSLEPARLRRVPRQAAPAGREPGAARRARPSSTSWPTGRFYYGLLRALCRAGPAVVVADVVRRGGRQLRDRRPDRHRRASVLAGRRRGAGDASWCCAGCCRWPTRAWSTGESTAAVSDRLLGIIEHRCITHQNGAEWQARTFHHIDDSKQPLDRRDSLREMLASLRRPHAQQRARAHLADRLSTTAWVSARLPGSNPGNRR